MCAMPLRIPSYHARCIGAGTVLATIYVLLKPPASPSPTVAFFGFALVGAVFGHVIGSAAPDRRPYVHRAALLGVAAGAALAIVRAMDGAGAFATLAGALWLGGLVASAHASTVLRSFKVTAIGMIGAILWMLFRGTPMPGIGTGAIILALGVLTNLVMFPLIDQMAHKLGDAEKQRRSAAAKQDKLEIERGRINERRQAGNVQQSRGEDSSEGL
jgi:hypothetical protein